MYLMGLVNSTMVARRPTDHVELVDLSVEKKKAQERFNREQKALTNGTPARSPRRHAPEAQPADLCMEPLFPLFLTSGSSDSSDGELSVSTMPSSQEEVSPKLVSKTEEKTEKSRDASLELEQKPRKQREMKQGKATVAPKVGRMLSEGGVSTRVQRHPLEVIPEQEHSDEHIVRANIDRPAARVLQHPLERVDEDPRKSTTKKERKPVVAPSPQPGGRKFVRESKLDVKQQPSRQPVKREGTKPRESVVPTTKPKTTKLITEAPNDREKPSLANPVLEKMEGPTSPSWNQKFQNLPKLAVTEPLMEERELRYSSPKMTDSDVQDELSFRVWERECIPKRKVISVSSDFQDLDLGSSIANPNAENLKQQLSPLNVEVQEESVHNEYPSPSSFTCGLSPTSLFSDDDNVFSRFQQHPEFRSVHSDDSSDTGHHHHPASNDESSDLESPNAELNARSFSTFTYTDKDVELTTSEEENVDVTELQYFQEANRREPWLGKSLDETDLDFLLPSIPQENSEISEENSQGTWIPCNEDEEKTKTTRSLPRRQHSRSGSRENLQPPRRSVKFAPELVQEITPTRSPSTNLKPFRIPRPASSPKDDDEHIYPSVKSWEIKDDTDVHGTPPSRRRWRTALYPKREDGDASLRRRWRRCRWETRNAAAASHRQILPCAGRLFSRLSFKVSRSRAVASDDDESIAGTESFGRSARRDALQVRRILEGSQKRFSNLTVADILKDNFQDKDPESASR